MPTIQPDDTITIAFSVTNRARTIAWYREHLGFEELYSADDAGWSELATNSPGVTIGLADATEVQPGNTMPVFGVTDFDSSRAALEAAGVTFDGDPIVVEGMVKTVAFLDPDGNPVMIAQDLTKEG